MISNASYRVAYSDDSIIRLNIEWQDASGRHAIFLYGADAGILFRRLQSTSAEDQQNILREEIEKGAMV